ncbi:MAG TPA: hypothetical protein VNP20_07795 [Nocardioidaceae bacterium]|nr:hypothetical protein [Nocardioidaceae bacterium]
MRALVTILFILLGLTACSGDDSPDSNNDQVASEVPGCSEVWVDGETLPDDYEGCADEDGGLVAAETTECESGETFTTYEDRFYAVLGGEITEAPSDSPEYQQAHDECTGG